MTNLINVILLVIYVTVSVGGLTLIKLGQGWYDRISWLGFVLYASGFALWILFLMRVPLSRAFPLAAGCLIVATQFAGWYILKEELNGMGLLGVAIMLLAIAIIFHS
jgi:multidrug transporter EmrE-like cation transporter